MNNFEEIVDYKDDSDKWYKDFRPRKQTIVEID